LLWPDSEPADARRALRNALSLLRDLLEDEAAPAQHGHLLSERELLGLDAHTPLHLDLQEVQHAWQAAQSFSAVPPEPQRAALLAQVQHALALGAWLTLP
jgi:DNA-binding SARP family transcriptional activator